MSKDAFEYHKGTGSNNEFSGFKSQSSRGLETLFQGNIMLPELWNLDTLVLNHQFYQHWECKPPPCLCNPSSTQPIPEAFNFLSFTEILWCLLSDCICQRKAPSFSFLIHLKIFTWVSRFSSFHEDEALWFLLRLWSMLRYVSPLLPALSPILLT